MINWELVKEITMWDYDVLIQKMIHALSYKFIKKYYNHNLNFARNYSAAIFSKLEENAEQLLTIETTLQELQKIRMKNYLELLHTIDTKIKCEGFLAKNPNITFIDLIITLNFIFLRVFPTAVPIRDLLDPSNVTQLQYLATLKKQNIITNFDLLENGLTKALRADLSAKTNIPDSFIYYLVNNADLSRLPYVRYKIIEHLCKTGYYCLELIENSTVEKIQNDLINYFNKIDKEFSISTINLEEIYLHAKIIPKIVER
ncbi:MAG: hypothetical protein FK734_01565 [Asgard group archaeon]|nr:hypothetical protein [Asgard group archaeon]